MITTNMLLDYKLGNLIPSIQSQLRNSAKNQMEGIQILLLTHYMSIGLKLVWLSIKPMIGLLNSVSAKNTAVPTIIIF